jgi:hypothetical protein
MKWNGKARMYEINCADCGRIGFHPSRVGAQSRADTHIDETKHDCEVVPMTNI